MTGSVMMPRPFTHLGTASFELRFHEHHHGSIRLAHRDQCGNDQCQGDERQVPNNDVDTSADVVGADVANVGPLHVDNAFIGSESFMKLTMPRRRVQRPGVRHAAKDNQ